MEIAEFLAREVWTEDRIEVSFDPELVRSTTVEIESNIEREWVRLKAMRPSLFDGPLCRVATYTASASGLSIVTGPTSYREYRGANKLPVSDEFRPNPLCVCAIVHTADDKLVLGRRSDTVGESESLWHVPGGHVEPGRHRAGQRILPGAAIREELEEELGIRPEAIREMKCIGFTRPEDTLKPELLYYARVDLDFAGMRHDREHSCLVPVEATRTACLEFAATHSMVMSGRACLKAYAELLAAPRSLNAAAR